MRILKLELVFLLNLLLVSGDEYNNDVSEHSLELTQSLNLARQELIQETCRHFPPRYSLDELPPSHLEHILINEEHKLLYCYVPKVSYSYHAKFMHKYPIYLLILHAFFCLYIIQP